MIHSDLSPVSVVSYSRDYLIDFIRHKTGWDQRNEVSDKTQLNYLCKYLEVDHINCQTIVVENEYIDRHYLEDYSEYYARCFPSHPRKCARLHFFSSKIEEYEFIENLTEFKSEFRDVLANSYLGFAVIRPIPHTFLAKVCIKPYEALVTLPSYKVIQNDYSVSLFGVHLTIKTTPFLEQDKVVAACATSALWTALSASPQLSLLSLPSPSAITKSASHPYFEGARTFPATGLTPLQVARSLKHFGLEPSVISCNAEDNFSSIKEHVFSYISNSIPVIVGGDVYELTSTGEYQHLGKHLVCAVGYHLGFCTINQGINLVSHQIDKIYVHDDRYGPFVRVNTEPKIFTVKGIQKQGLALSVHEQKEELFVPDVVIVGLYHKVRITYEYINSVCTSLYAYLASSAQDIDEALKQEKISDSELISHFSDKSACIRKYLRSTFEISLTTSTDVKKELLHSEYAWTFNGAVNKTALLLQNMPKYLWRCRVSECGEGGSSCVLTDILFDATEVPQGRVLIGFISYSKDADELWSYVETLITDREWQKYDFSAHTVKQHISCVLKFFGELKGKTYLNTLYGPPGLPRRPTKRGETDDLQNIQIRKDTYTVRRDSDGSIWKQLDPSKKYIWVINEVGDMVIGEDVADADGFKGHPTLIDGKPGRVAGELYFIEDGTVALVNLKSRAYSSHLGNSEEANGYLANVIKNNLYGLNVRVEPSPPHQ